jgi:LysM repeat protein
LTFTRLTLAPARKHARALTLCTAAIAGVAMPTLASAATVGSTHAATTAAVAHTASTKTVRANAVAVSTSTSNTGSSTDSGSATTTYTVVAGDTLFDIAKRTLGDGNSYNQLFQLNKDRSETGGATFTNPDLIDVGWTLLLPADGSAATSNSATTTQTTTDSASTDPTQSTQSSSGSSSSDSSDQSNAASTTDSSSSSGQATSSGSYADNLDGWINQAISVLSAHGYSVSYNAIYQTAMNESSGNPDATNGWDSNAAAGTPSIGLMQMIQPTFDAYAISGYNDIYNPVDNIISAVVYAQTTYGGLDNVVADRCGGSCWSGY